MLWVGCCQAARVTLSLRSLINPIGKAERMILSFVNKEPPLNLAKKGGRWSFLWFGQCSIFACAQT